MTYKARGCPRCEDRKIVDPVFLNEAQSAFASLTVDLIKFCNDHKVDHRKLPVLQKVAHIIRILEMM